MSRCLLLCLLLSGLLPIASRAQRSPPSAVAAEPPPDPMHDRVDPVRALVRQAGDLLGRGDTAGAVATLVQARRLRPDATLDYNLGVAYAAWGRPAEAAAAFERFLQAARPDAVPKDRIEEARRQLKELTPRLGRISVRAADGGPASVLIDHRALGQTPLLGHFEPPGAHEVRVTRPGARDFIVRVDLAAGEDRLVTAQPAPLPAAHAMALVPVQGPLPDPPLYRRWWFWTAIGGGAVLAAGLIGAGAAGRFNRLAPGSDLDALEVAR